MYQIFYHPKVQKEILKLNKREIFLLKKIIEEKLLISPTRFGKTLQGTLKNYKSFRFGKHRVVFRVTNNKVFIIAVGLRKEIYEKTQKRLEL